MLSAKVFVPWGFFELGETKGNTFFVCVFQGAVRHLRPTTTVFLRLRSLLLPVEIAFLTTSEGCCLHDRFVWGVGLVA